MKFKSILGKTIELTTERKEHILAFHPDLEPYFGKLNVVLLEPDEIRISKSDPKTLLFYKYFANIVDRKYIAVVVKSNQRFFVLTSYLTDRILSGEKYEES